MMVLIDTEFTAFIGPELLSLGMATAGEPVETFYAEVDLTSGDGKRLVAQSSDFVREEVLTQWGRIPDTAGTAWEVGRRAGEWLLALHARINRDETGIGGRLHRVRLFGRLRTARICDPARRALGSGARGRAACAR